MHICTACKNFASKKKPLDCVLAVSFLFDRQRHPMQRNLRNAFTHVQASNQNQNLVQMSAVAQHCDFSVYGAFQPKDFPVRATNTTHVQQWFPSSHQSFLYIYIYYNVGFLRRQSIQEKIMRQSIQEHRVQRAAESQATKKRF